MLIEHVDLEKKSPKVIKCISSRLKLNLEAGSQDSLDFLDLVLDADDDVLYLSQIDLFVEYKWRQ